MHKIKVKKTQYGINSTNELQHAHQIILRYLIDPHAGINRYPPLHYMSKNYEREMIDYLLMRYQTVLLIKPLTQNPKHISRF